MTATPTPTGTITPAEVALLSRLAAGETTATAAAHLGITTEAAWKQLTRARRRTGTRTTAQLISHAIATGQLPAAATPAPARDTRHRIETALHHLGRSGGGALLDLTDEDDLAAVVNAILPAVATTPRRPTP